MIKKQERRDFIKGVGLAATAATLASTTAFAQGNPPPSKVPPYQPKTLSFDPKSISGISEKVLVSHYENNYVGAVKRLNAIGMQLAELDFAKAPNFVLNGLKREELIATNSMILHEIYFDGLGGGNKVGGTLADAITRDFGSFDRWRCRVLRDGQGGRRWFGLGDPRLLPARQAAGQSMGGRSHHDPRGRAPGPCARYVRARLSHGLRRSSRAICRRVYGGYPLGQRGQAVRTIQPGKLNRLPWKDDCRSHHRPRRVANGVEHLPSLRRALTSPIRRRLYDHRPSRLRDGAWLRPHGDRDRGQRFAARNSAVRCLRRSGASSTRHRSEHAVRTFLMAATGIAFPDVEHLVLIGLVAFVGTANPSVVFQCRWSVPCWRGA